MKILTGMEIKYTLILFQTYPSMTVMITYLVLSTRKRQLLRLFIHPIDCQDGILLLKRFTNLN